MTSQGYSANKSLLIHATFCVILLQACAATATNTDLSTDETDYRETSNDNDLIHSFLSEALSKSQIVQDHSHVFIQLGKYLTENTTSSKHESESKNSEKLFNSNTVVRRQNGGDHVNNAVRISSDVNGEKRLLPGYNAWPLLSTFPSNTSISRQMKPPGYMKQEGVDFELSQQVLNTLNHHVTKIGATLKPYHKHSRETLNLYSKHKR